MNSARHIFLPASGRGLPAEPRSCRGLPAEQTVPRVAPGFTPRPATSGAVREAVEAFPAAPGSLFLEFLEGAFAQGMRAVSALQGTYRIDVLRPERLEVAIDSSECAGRRGRGELALGFGVRHGVVLGSVDPFGVQGLGLAEVVGSIEEQQSRAVDRLGDSPEELPATRRARWWRGHLPAAWEVGDRSVIRLVTNFVRLRRLGALGKG